MTSAVTDHYAKHLAPIYAWMVGSFDDARDKARAFYEQIGAGKGNTELAIDLGCGHGVHAVALAQLGYRVNAIETSDLLLAELETQSRKLPITCINADLTLFRDHCSDQHPHLISCMGDTLPHLPTLEHVERLIADIASAISSDGYVTCSLRDYCSTELVGTERFIPVRADEGRVHICFLDYGSDQIVVHDIICSLTDKGWQTTVGAYPKLRLSIDNLIAVAASHGLTVVHRLIDRGMVYLAFRKMNRHAG